jgi:cytidine deaminase
MKKIEIATAATLFNDVSELSLEDKMLMDKAVEARKKA